MGHRPGSSKKDSNDMLKSVKSKAQQQFAKTQKNSTVIIEEKEIARREREEKVAHLRALRLAKETADAKKSR